MTSATSLNVKWSVVSPQNLLVDYVVDDLTGSMSLQYPPVVDLSVHADTVGMHCAVYLAQLCLPSTLVVQKVARGAEPLLAAQLDMLYGIRAWRDHAPIRSVQISADATFDAVPLKTTDNSKPVVLLSGGKDSSLVWKTLSASGGEPPLLHISINDGVRELELDAATRTAGAMSRHLDVVSVEHPEFIAHSTRYAVNWNKFPVNNVVPFGRDFLLAGIALPYVAANELSALAFGHDAECRSAFVVHEGRTFPRNDAESASGSRLSEALLRTSTSASFALHSPISPLTEFRILGEMLTRYPNDMSRAAFCFFSHRCGKCFKCLRYRLADMLFTGGTVIHFDEDPLTDPISPELELLFASYLSGGFELFQSQTLDCLSALANTGSQADAIERWRGLAPEYPHLGAHERLQESLRPLVDPEIVDSRYIAYWQAEPWPKLL